MTSVILLRAKFLQCFSIACRPRYTCQHLELEDTLACKVLLCNTTVPGLANTFKG